MNIHVRFENSLLNIPMYCKIKKVLDLLFESFIKIASQSVYLDL